MIRNALTTTAIRLMSCSAALVVLTWLALVSLQSDAAAKGEKAGRFDYLTLALSWSPTYCANDREAADEPQCDGQRPYAFVLHGLWPQYTKGWPEFCETEKKPWVPREVITSMLDIMPSPRLVIHQYRKHGTCSGLDAATFFKASRALFGRVSIPQEFVRPDNYLRLSPGAIEAAFLKANPTLKPDAIVVDCGRRDQLREIRICFTPRGQFRSCTDNEDQRRLCRATKVTMPPVRQSAPTRSTAPRPDDRRPRRPVERKGERLPL